MKGMSTATWLITGVVFVIAVIFILFIVFASIGAEAPSSANQFYYQWFDYLVGSLPGAG